MTSNTAAINQMACMEAMQGPQDAVVRMHDEYARRRRYMMDRLNAMSGVRCPDAKGAFYVFPNVGALYGKSDGKRSIRNSSDLAAYLLEEAHVADLRQFHGKHHRRHGPHGGGPAEAEIRRRECRI